MALIGAEKFIHKPPTLDEFINEVGNAIEDMLRESDPVATLEGYASH